MRAGDEVKITFFAVGASSSLVFVSFPNGMGGYLGSLSFFVTWKDGQMGVKGLGLEMGGGRVDGWGRVGERSVYVCINVHVIL